ncbi:MAG: hypothetical protein V1739_07940 [Candidatus Omnitrophota bacterium]
MINSNQELRDYLTKAEGISRRGLNIMCFIGVFIFGWLLAVVFGMLGRKNQGWFYIVPLIVILSISRTSESGIVILAPVIYLAGWIHANMVLSRYESLARQRIIEIDSCSSPDDVQNLLEKGLLEAKVLHQKQKAVLTFLKVLEFEGGSADYLNLAGVALFSDKRYEDAKNFFDRALLSAENEILIKQIKQNQVNAEKKIQG